MKYLIIFITILAVIIVGVLILGGTIFTAAVDEAEITTQPPELEVTPFYNIPMPVEHQLIVHNLCELSGLSEPFVYGVIYAESGFDPAAVNPRTGCYGYMQLDPTIYPPEDHNTPSRNLYAGVSLLAELSKEFEDPVTVLLTYNNGKTGAKRLIKSGVTSTPYTRKVLAYADKLMVKGRIYEEITE